MSKDYELYLDNILEAAEKIGRYVSGLSYGDFAGKSLVSDAVIRNLEIIGEAVKKLPEELKRKHPEIEWKKIAGFRDILAHEYAGVSLRIVWDIVENKLPELREKIIQMRKERNA